MANDPLRHYVMQDSYGIWHGPVWEMLESESIERNLMLSECESDFRWSIVPELGIR